MSHPKQAGARSMIKKTNSVMIDTLNELIGIDAARNLAMIYGGTKFYICESPLCFMRLTLIMGRVNAQKMIAEFKGTTIEIPRFADAIKKERADEVRADHDSGMSVRDIALKHELTERGARMILNNAN